ncbi:MAG: succinate dehydrogenase, hydrophobic membrane anchor protein [Proteobacteria bacterium]|nr:succinate dehydrogenase, hydrophobic membrane anchor protein [Pseudomonadota bacterium]
MSLRTPIGRARGLGSAKEGTHHWWHQRVTAVALVLLSGWFVISLIVMTGASYEEVRAWIGHPVVTGLLLLTIVFTFYHLKLGLQVVIEDYVHSEMVKLGSLMLMSGACLVVGLACGLSVLYVAFGG